MSIAATIALPRIHAAARALAGAILLVLNAIVHADVIDIRWQDSGRFERSFSVAPGEFAELCGPLKPGQTVKWTFEADGAVDFNIHYHVDKDVRYPARKDQVKSLQGEFVVDSVQDHCWMWVNKSTQSTRVAVALGKV
jgi:hypothetical protein